MIEKIRIGNKVVGENEPIFIIAEAGINFNNLAEAKKMVDVAKELGADAIKFQTFRADTITTKKAIFDMENIGIASQYEIFKKYELSEKMHREIFRYAKKKRIIAFSTPSHREDVELLERVGVPMYKVGSDDLYNLPFLEYIAKKGKPMIVSTGMSELSEVGEAVNTIFRTGNRKLILLQCVTNYPAYPKDANLRAMKTMEGAFKVNVGYSDHTIGIAVPIAAAALGAKVIEKHFTLDKNAPGPDNYLSADPMELKMMIEGIRNVEKAMGNGIKRPAKSEAKTVINNRKSVVAVKDIPAGALVRKDMVDIKRPGTGIPPKYINFIIGRKARKNIEAEDVITWDMI